MAWHPMKPETIERRRLQHIKERAEGRANLIRRLEEAVQEHGKDSIYQEMLDGMLSRTN